MPTYTARLGEDGKSIRVDLPGDSAIIDGHVYALTIPLVRDLTGDLLRARWDLLEVQGQTLLLAPVPPMNSPTFRAIREYLGLPASWCADRFDVQERTIRKWDQGESLIPAGVAASMYEIARQTSEFVDQQALLLRGDHPPVFDLPRTPRDLAGMTPVNDFPLDWWRSVGARLVEQVPGLVLDWIDFED